VWLVFTSGGGTLGGGSVEHRRREEGNGIYTYLLQRGESVTFRKTATRTSLEEGTLLIEEQRRGDSFSFSTKKIQRFHCTVSRGEKSPRGGGRLVYLKKGRRAGSRVEKKRLKRALFQRPERKKRGRAKVAFFAHHGRAKSLGESLADSLTQMGGREGGSRRTRGRKEGKKSGREGEKRESEWRSRFRRREKKRSREVDSVDGSPEKGKSDAGSCWIGERGGNAVAAIIHRGGKQHAREKDVSWRSSLIPGGEGPTACPFEACEGRRNVSREK